MCIKLQTFMIFTSSPSAHPLSRSTHHVRFSVNFPVLRCRFPFASVAAAQVNILFQMCLLCISSLYRVRARGRTVPRLRTETWQFSGSRLPIRLHRRRNPRTECERRRSRRAFRLNKNENQFTCALCLIHFNSSSVSLTASSLARFHVFASFFAYFFGRSQSRQIRNCLRRCLFFIFITAAKRRREWDAEKGSRAKCVLDYKRDKMIDEMCIEKGAE